MSGSSTTSDKPALAIVIPALNEAGTIADVVTRAATHGTPIVIDDGSTDATGDVAAQAGANVVRHERNRGYDGALDSGFARAGELGCEFVVTMDADGQHDPAILERFVRELEKGADVVLGVRDRKQRAGEIVFAAAARWRWGIKDPLCGMKGYRMTTYADLGHFDSYQSIGTELALFAARTGRRIVQLPVKTRDRVDAPRFGRRFSANWRILRAMFIGMFRRANA